MFGGQMIPNQPGFMNPGQMNPGQMNPGQMNPGQMNPGQMSQGPLGPPGPPPPPGPSGLNHPAQNNQPLQFNLNKGQPLAIPGNGLPEERTDFRDKPEDAGNSGPDTPLAMGPGMQQAAMGGPMGPMGSWGPMMTPMGMDPNMMINPMGYQQYGYMGPMGPVPDGPPPKEIITLKNCILYPPPPNAPPPSTRERPPGCRTIFVGGLPESINEDMLREVFDRCGPISSTRMSKKNFAHVRFDNESSVDQGLYLSGYRMKLDNKDDKPNTGRIHVDYAQARDDLYEWECNQRSLAREMRHRQRVEEDRLRPPSPPPIIHFSDHEASSLTEMLKSDESFMKATQILITWLERGDCSRRTANTFYTLIQSTNSHVRRLMNEKGILDDEFEQMKIKFRNQQEAIIRQFEQIEKVFGASSRQKAWDHFSKAQRKNLDVWKKQCHDVRETQQEEFLMGRDEAEMEMSDSEEGEAPIKKKKLGDESGISMMAEWQVNVLREENDSLKCQLEGFKNEVDLLKQEGANSIDFKDRQLKALQQALQGMQQQLMSAKQQMKQDEDEISQLRRQRELREANETIEIRDSAPVILDDDDDEEQTPSISTSRAKDDKQPDSSAAISTASRVISSPHSSHSSRALVERDAKIIGCLCTFLVVHPFGASVEYICSYLQRLDLRVRSSELEDIMERFSGLFKKDLHGVGASLEKRWRFMGFDTAAGKLGLMF